MDYRRTRRFVVKAAVVAAFAPHLRSASAQAPEPRFVYPIALPGRPFGDGLFVRHGYAVENTWYLPGYFHTGEDWYAVNGETAGIAVFAIAAGEVVFVGSDYPGRVVIVRHEANLFSMYGHLDYAVAVVVGQGVGRGERLGTVLDRSDANPNHLHFEVRTFLTTAEVNGAAPRYGFGCGPDCPPGPGYWPIDAPDHPGALGWRNPVHVVARRAFPSGLGDVGAEVVVAAQPTAAEVTVWSAPPNEAGAERTGTLPLRPGARLPLLGLHAGPEDVRQTSAEGYELWYRLGLADGATGWVQAAVPTRFETGSDGRPSTVSFNLYPAVLPVT